MLNGVSSWTLMSTMSGGSQTTLNSGYFYGNVYAYYAGSTKVVKNISPSVSYNYKVGYIMNYFSGFSCLNYNEITTSKTLTSETSFSSLLTTFSTATNFTSAS